MSNDPPLELKLFVGTSGAIRALAGRAGNPPIYKPGTLEHDLLVLPMDDLTQDRLHRAYGTGDWPDPTIALSSGDLKVCAKVSLGGRLAFINAIAEHNGFHQSAAAWSDGHMSVRPLTLAASDQANRPRRLWPINVALAELGIPNTGQQDAMAASGLMQFASNDEL
ncbi:MAG: hypothetical protein AAFO75_12325, partial [Pseudomonadota bacterium]